TGLPVARGCRRGPLVRQSTSVIPHIVGHPAWSGHIICLVHDRVGPSSQRDRVISRTEVIRMTGGQLVVECLVRHGVEVVFGIPGAHTMAIYDGLYRHPRIKHTLARHEQSAALMADGYARATGKPGVCCVTTGPGVTNAATGLAVAHGDSIPVLLISSQVHSEAARRRRGLFHAMDQLALTRPITKWNGRANNPQEIPQAIAEAFRALTRGRPGAGHLEVPLDLLQQE